MLYQICILNARLAAAESMTHDVIRDLLGVKLDLTKYAVSFCLLFFWINNVFFFLTESKYYACMLLVTIFALGKF